MKTWSAQFHDIRLGYKPYEYRWNDRDFQVGDTLILEEFIPEEGLGYTGDRIGPLRVTHITDLTPFGSPGYVILSWGPWAERSTLLTIVRALLKDAQRSLVQQKTAALVFAHMGRVAAFRTLLRVLEEGWCGR